MKTKTDKKAATVKPAVHIVKGTSKNSTVVIN
jgi:hypothetical protein